MRLFEDDGKSVLVPDDVYEQLVALVAEREYLDKRQYNLKIQQNSLYGALSNPHFRYFDPRLGNSTTGTGREVLMHITRKVGEHFDGKYEYPTPSSIYGDTDSSYFKTGGETLEESRDRANAFAKVVNESMVGFMEEMFLCKGKYARQIKVAREVIADKGIFVKKKMYMLHVVDKKGKPTDEVKIMGLMLKKTQIPKHISEVVKAAFEDLLVHGDWKSFNLKIIEYRELIGQRGITEDIKLVGIPKTVKDMAKYGSKVDSYVAADRIPGHVRAAASFNRALLLHGDKETDPIRSGTKIKLYHLRNAMGKLDKTIALPTDLYPIPEWFLEHYVPRINLEAQLKRLIDAPVQQVLSAVGRRIPTRDDLVVEECFEF